MRTIIQGLNKYFDNRVRLGIMSALMVNDSVEFNALKELLGVTDGNLASHLKALEKAGLVSVQKQFVGRKPNTTYQITQEGRARFAEHINALEILIRNSEQ
ncbi:MAG: transcriptional regulator [Breznakibacter sp.]